MASIMHSTEKIIKSYSVAFPDDGERQGTALYKQMNSIYVSTQT